MESTIRVITCPHCRNMLYALEVSKGDGAAQWNVTQDSPAIQADAGGHFVTCRGCAKRVAVEKVSGPGIESWMVARAR